MIVMSGVLQLLVLLVVWPVAHAACLDPKDPTLSRYDNSSIEEEAESAVAIVVAKVVKVQGLTEDPTDRAGFTSYLYTVQVFERLKGRTENVLTIKVSNDSGGYRMVDGETHLLFLRTSRDGYSVDSCGNSSEISKGRAIAEQVRLVLTAGPLTRSNKPLNTDAVGAGERRR